jgi:hypothetical protein
MELQNAAGSARRPPVWMAAVFIAIGLCVVAAALGLIPTDPNAPPGWVVGCVGALFSLAGLLITCQDQPASLHARLFGASFFSLFALVFGWVGFGPGPRTFGTTTMAVGAVALHTSSSETGGRIVFGAFGILVALVALAAWWSFAKTLLGTSRHD